MSDKFDVLHSGEIYDPNDPELMSVQQECLRKLHAFNKLDPDDIELRMKTLKEMFGDMGENCYIETPFQSNWAGRHCHFGNNVYANFNLTLVDDTHIYVGDNTMFGPNVVIATAAHPLDPEARRKGLQYNKPVHIGKNCWIGSGVTILPGVTIGDNTVIGAGSVVTKDIPSNVVAFGNPCRVQSEIEVND